MPQQRRKTKVLQTAHTDYTISTCLFQATSKALNRLLAVVENNDPSHMLQ